MTLTMRVVAFAVFFTVAACSSEAATTTTTAPDDTTTTAPVTATTSAPTTTTTVQSTTTTAPTTTTQPEAVPVDVVYAGGVVETERRITVPLGEKVILTVEADVDDEVHVHGYDLYVDVAPDTPGTLEFDADIPGIFEVELEGSHTLLVELEVTP